ncbi:CoA pyrophosphatase [Alicyclobacillus tolerans]|uniref:NUDIX hydrolase n=1 Tax=Alicyclobacillus tolerans TaxID=90970 RepID=UPI001F27505E|nr:CoA pyrophosphatase [Alicyclobacillus tolerans]MCF8566251.1 CoA pyrophosphatase [Alicyclobacillus tolerans]
MTVEPSDLRTLKIATIKSVLKDRPRKLLGEEGWTKTAVLVPLVKQAGHWTILFEERAHTLKRQPGEISFPGGHCDPGDPDEQSTAIRETSEELGVLEKDIEVIGDLDVLVTGAGLMVFPFAGVLPQDVRLQPNPHEVATAFSVSLAELLSTQPLVYEVTMKADPPDDYPYHLIPGGRSYPFRKSRTIQYFYQVNGYVIWGLTARILTHFLDVIRDKWV